MKIEIMGGGGGGYTETRGGVHIETMEGIMKKLKLCVCVGHRGGRYNYADVCGGERGSRYGGGEYNYLANLGGGDMISLKSGRRGMIRWGGR